MDYSLDVGLEHVEIISLEEAGDHLEVVLQSKSSSAVCPTCNTPSTSVKDRYAHRIITRPIQSFPIQLSICKRRFFCLNSSCKTHSFTEQIQGLPKKHIYTTQFEDFVSDLYQHMDFPTIKKRLSQNYHLDIPHSTICLKLKDKPEEHQLVSYPVHAKYIGIDEFSYSKGHNYAVGLIKIEKDNKKQKSKIIDMAAGGKTTATAKAVMNSIVPSFVEACCIDMWKPFRIACKEKLTNARIVVDKFHVVKLINEAIQSLIKRISQRLTEDQRKLVDENKYPLILKGREKLNDDTTYNLQYILQFDKELETIYQFKEWLRCIYMIKDTQLAYEQLHTWLYRAKLSHIPELIEVAQTYSEWFTEIFNYFYCPISNGVTEGKINKIRVIQAKAYHYKNFRTLRYQVLKAEL